jgi:hypothetical protein
MNYIESKYIYDLWEQIGILEYSGLRYFICLYRIEGLEYVKDDIFYELIFKQLSVLLVILAITMPRQSCRFLMIFFIWVVRTFVLACRIATDFYPQRSVVCYISGQVFCCAKKRKKKSKRRRDQIILFLWLSLYNTKVACWFCLGLDFTNNLSHSFWYIT